MPERFEYFVVECLKCARTVYKEINAVPIRSHGRWRCTKCGNRGASLIRTWSWRKPDFSR